MSPVRLPTYPQSSTYHQSGKPSALHSNTSSGSYIWPSSSAPKYVPGFSVTTSLMFANVFVGLLLMILTRKYPYEMTVDGGQTQPQERSEAADNRNGELEV